MSDEHFPRILAPPRQSFFLFGPRGSGKSTWLKRHFPMAHVVDLLDEERYQSLLAEPSLFHDMLGGLPSGLPPQTPGNCEDLRMVTDLSAVHRPVGELFALPTSGEQWAQYRLGDEQVIDFTCRRDRPPAGAGVFEMPDEVPRNRAKIARLPPDRRHEALPLRFGKISHLLKDFSA